MKSDILILSVPYCEPLPLVAPVLLAGCLESAGISARGIDFNADFLKEFSNKLYFPELKNFLIMGALIQPSFDIKVYKEVVRWTKRYLLDLKKIYDPKYIGISIFTSESLDFGLILSYLIRRYLPEVTLIAGGKGLEVSDHSGRNHYQNWIDNQVVDAIIVGDAETAIIDLIKNNTTGLVYADPQTKQDLDAIPMAKWDDYDLSIYADLAKVVDQQTVIIGANWGSPEPYLSVTASKGCVRQCTFCDVANFWPDYIYRDPTKVAEEIIFNYRKTGIKKFSFTDNLINGSVSNFRSMNQILADKIPNQITYGGYAIFRGKNDMPERDFQLAAAAGNNFWSVGVESGSERLRYEMKKKFDDEDLDWSVRTLHKYKIFQNWLLMVGYPSESDQDFQQSVKLLHRYKNLSSAITIQITPTFMLLNNSPLLNNHELATTYGLAHLKNMGGTMNKFWSSTRFVDNDYPTRSLRWKTLMRTVEECGYKFGPGMPIKKWRDEIEHLDKIYHEQKIKVIPIFASQ
jgi:radical SAM superfamily enzyme YgiQ (UPF0313 family)